MHHELRACERVHIMVSWYESGFSVNNTHRRPMLGLQHFQSQEMQLLGQGHDEALSVLQTL